MQSARRVGFYFGADAVILGSGLIGLMALEAVKTLGTGDIIVVDVIPNRLEIAKKMGADYVINTKEVAVEKKVRELTNGEGVHFVFESAGTSKTFSQSVYLAKQGGKVILTGIIQENVIPMPMGTMIFKDIDIIPMFRYYMYLKKQLVLLPIKEQIYCPLKPMNIHLRRLLRHSKQQKKIRKKLKSSDKYLINHINREIY